MAESSRRGAAHRLRGRAAWDRVEPHLYQVDHASLSASANRPCTSVDRPLRSGADRPYSCLLVSAADVSRCTRS